MDKEFRAALRSSAIRNAPVEDQPIICHLLFGIPQNQCAAHWKISTSAMSRGVQAVREGRDPFKPGRPPVVAASSLDDFTAYVKSRYAEDRPFTPRTLREHLQETPYSGRLHKQLAQACEDWPAATPPPSVTRQCAHTIIKRSEELKRAHPREKDAGRFRAATTATVRAWFDKVYTEEFVRDIPAAMVWNVDETGVVVKPPRSLIVPSDVKHCYVGDIRKKLQLHITGVVAFSAAGKRMKPLLILPLQLVPKSAIQLLRDNHIHVAGSRTGYMTRSIFEAWTEQFIEKVERVRGSYGGESQRCILTSDGHGSRRAPAALRSMKNKNIDCVLFPSHLTHVLQPFDFGVAGPLKQSLERIRDFLTTAAFDETKIDDLRKLVLEGFVDACQSQVTILTCRQAFAKTGIFPRNPAMVLDDNEELRDSDFDAEAAADQTASRLRISGKVITRDNVIETIEAEDAARASSGTRRPRGHQGRQTRAETHRDIQETFASEPACVLSDSEEPEPWIDNAEETESSEETDSDDDDGGTAAAQTVERAPCPRPRPPRPAGARRSPRRPEVDNDPDLQDCENMTVELSPDELQQYPNPFSALLDLWWEDQWDYLRAGVDWARDFIALTWRLRECARHRGSPGELVHMPGVALEMIGWGATHVVVLDAERRVRMTAPKELWCPAATSSWREQTDRIRRCWVIHGNVGRLIRGLIEKAVQGFAGNE